MVRKKGLEFLFRMTLGRETSWRNGARESEEAELVAQGKRSRIGERAIAVRDGAERLRLVS